MNYFEFYGGDFLRDTADLGPLEQGVYLAFLLTNYGTERPLPADCATLCRIARATTKDERAAVATIADRFYPIGVDGMRHNSRAEREIEKAQRRIAAARENGKHGGRRPKPRANPLGSGQEPSGFDLGTPDRTQSGEALQAPCSKLQAGELSLSVGTPTPETSREPAPSPTDAVSESERQEPKPIGVLCKALRAAGMVKANPHDAWIKRLVDDGIPIDEAVGTFTEFAASNPNGKFLHTVIARRRDEAASARSVAPAKAAPTPASFSPYVPEFRARRDPSAGAPAAAAEIFKKLGITPPSASQAGPTEGVVP